MVMHGELFLSPADQDVVEAFIPPMGYENHAASMLELPNGDLLCAWFAGSAEGISDVKIAISRLPFQHNQWTAPMFVSQDATRSEQNPNLFLAPDGKIWLFYTAQETRGCTKEEWEARVKLGLVEGSYTMQWTAVIRRRVSDDHGYTWGPVEDYFKEPSSFCRQPMVVMSNGEWLYPMYYSLFAPGHGDDFTVMQISANQGKTWTEYPVPNSRGRVHASVVEISAGTMAAFFRSRAADRIYVSRSTNYGRTWTEPERTVLPNNNASIQAVRLVSGNIAIIFNNHHAQDDATKTVWPRERYPLTVALSEDGGNTWPYMRNIDTSDGLVGASNSSLNRGCAYPCMLQTSDGFIHIGYSYRPRQCIKYIRISEGWIKDQLEYIWQDPPEADRRKNKPLLG
jgi:predicted neuraminidase